MDQNEIISKMVMAIAVNFRGKGIGITFDKTKELIQEICKKSSSSIQELDIDKMAKEIQTSVTNVGQTAFREETLSRYLEIPFSDLATVNPDNLQTDVLFNHVKLEQEFKEWLTEWGYAVEFGCTLMGLRGVEYIPDVYGILNTLHGKFEICINFVCDKPPDEDRVFALLGRIEAYAEAKKTFSYSDIFAIITPTRFTQAALNAMALQNEQENYSVISLDGPDVNVLEQTENARNRLDEFQEKVRQAEEESKRAKIKKSVNQSEEETR